MAVSVMTVEAGQLEVGMMELGRLGLAARLCIPEKARGVVLCIDESGSRLLDACHGGVASALNDAAFATLAIDLLTTNEHADEAVAGYRYNDIPLLASRVVSATDLREDPRGAAAHAAALGYPVFVKPANAGSSVGVSKVNDPSGLEPALRAALSFDRKVLLERGVDAREIEVAVLGNDRPTASVPGEIIVHHRDGFYSYDAKYVDADGAAWQIPADLPKAIASRVQELAVATFRTLELAGMARVDFFVERTTSEIFVNEVNTIPGFTAISMYPKMWEASGVSATDLVTRLINLAIERRDARRGLSTSLPVWGR